MSFTFNSYGYPTSYYNGSDYTFSWDKYGNLSGSTIEGVAQSYTYDIGGQRKTKTANGVISTYYYSGNTLLAQINSNDTSLLFHYDESGNPVGFTRRVNGTPYNYYYVTNLQGDVIQIVNGDFNVVCNYYYDAWGAIRKITDGSGNDITNSTNQYSVAYLNPIRYRGYYYDVETGLYYLQTRYYDPEIGRFISRDSYEYIGATGDLGSYNLFAYCSNNPCKYEDPSGQFWEELFEGLRKSLNTCKTLVDLYCMGFKDTTWDLAEDCYETLEQCEIDTVEEKSHFFSQCYVEGNLSLLEAGYLDEESAEAYRKTKSYYPYYGAGYIQLTHEDNYKLFSEIMNDPLIYEIGPVYVAENYAWSAAGWYWSNRRINDVIANGATVKRVTQLVNGGEADLSEREQMYAQYLSYFGG